MEPQTPSDDSFPWAASESAFIEAVRAACQTHPELDESELCRQFDSEVHWIRLNQFDHRAKFEQIIILH